jgi:hypothetical protein
VIVFVCASTNVHAVKPSIYLHEPYLRSASPNMAFLFGGRGRQRSPAEIARALKEVLLKIEDNPKVWTFTNTRISGLSQSV